MGNLSAPVRKKISIIIKTFNEEANIDRAIRSAMEAVAPFHGEVIVADSASTDGTIEVARQFPITVVQITSPDERCCGVGPQLGYQHSASKYVYVLDGDMDLDAAFLHKAIGFLDREPRVAGVGGYVREIRVANLEFEARVRRQEKWQPRDTGTDVECLVGGGLYRRSAIEDVGYLSDRNLRAFEEYDLGVRLRRKGWRIVRLPDHAADHYAHQMDTSQLLLHRVRTGYIYGIGNLFRAALRGGYVHTLLTELRIADLAIGVWLYWGAVILVAAFLDRTPTSVAIIVTAIALPIGGMMVRLRSIKLGIFNVISWHISALGLLFGSFHRSTPPRDKIQSRVFRTAESN